MDRKILLLLAFLTSICTAMAVPAHKGAVSVKQPDGSTVTIRLHGDEFMSFTTTSDGYTVIKNEKGYYCYAVKQGGKLVTTDIVAHDIQKRDANETAFLATQAKMQHADMTAEQQQFKQRAKSLQKKDVKRDMSASGYDYSNFKGLIILVEYSDRPFQRSDANEFYNNMANTPDYNGYYDENGTTFNACTGSVRDYYYDNSNGIFDPSFDVVGPIQVSYVTTDAHKTSNFYPIAKEALQKANQYVNYADYDADNDGTVDMVYFIVSGYGSNYSGNDQNYLWPYASDLTWYSYYYGLKYDNMKFGRYACSVEMGGYEAYADYPEYSFIDGIGTICHEFSHVLGLEDHYDTNYEDDGLSNDPGNWDVMSGGSYLNKSRTPAGYNAFERYTLGFLGTLNYINEETEYSINPLNTSNEALRLNTKVNKEYFMLENRQKTRWDEYLPGHGMLIWRVDSTNTDVWVGNKVNCNPNHNYFELIRAMNGTGVSASDPFPGTDGVTEINNETTPSLKTWAGKSSKWGLKNIKEENYIITFGVEDVLTLTALTLPESKKIGVGMSTVLNPVPTPEYADFTMTWTSSNPSIASVDQEGRVQGLTIGTSIITVKSNNNITASCEISVIETPVCNISEFKSTDEGMEVILNLQDAEVLYVKDNQTYIRDASGSIIINDINLGVARNDIVNGELYAKLSYSNNMPIVVETENTSTSGITTIAGPTVQPREVHLEDLTEADYADYVLVKSAQLVLDNKQVYAVSGDLRVKYYNKLGVTGISLKNYNGKYFDLPVIYGTDVFNGSIINELYMLETPTEVEAPTGISSVSIVPEKKDIIYNIAGQRVNSNYKGIIIINGKKVINH